ncbi:MAG: hypothetical protein KAR79_00120, partial [Simkaniaceae bacterium]|nr:hypothetical protein [Simkaniaceae bacterium]
GLGSVLKRHLDHLLEKEADAGVYPLSTFVADIVKYDLVETLQTMLLSANSKDAANAVMCERLAGSQRQGQPHETEQEPEEIMAAQFDLIDRLVAAYKKR